MKKIIFIFGLIAVLSPFLVAVAADGLVLPPPDAWTQDKIQTLLATVANFLIWAGITLAIITLVVAGIIYFSSGFNAKNVDKAKGLFKNALIGIALIVGAGVIINTVAVLITGQFFGISGPAGGGLPINGGAGTLSSCLANNDIASCCQSSGLKCDPGCDRYYNTPEGVNLTRGCGANTSTGGLGEPCSNGRDCSARLNLKCNNHSGDSICVRKTGGNLEGEPCLGGNDCQTGLNCVGSVGNKVCTNLNN